MKRIKKLVAIVGILVFGIGSFHLGAIYKSQQGQPEKTYVTQNMIAVVNADEGALINGKKTNYAADFMSFPDINFTSTSLTDAREGVESGRYAAYIIIPNNFSQAITSINKKPEKASLVYEVSDNLREDIREDVLQDIRDFTTGLSTNISYVYVASIMDEFHGAQDGAKTVLENDHVELEEINAINNKMLISEFLFPEVKRKEWEVEEIDFAGHYEKLDETVHQLSNNYEAYLADGKLAFDELNQEKEVISTVILNITETMNSIDIEYRYADKGETVSQNQLVYAEGLTHLREFEKERMDRLSTTKNELGEIVIGESENADLEDVAQSISANQLNIERDIRDIAENQLDSREITISWNDIGYGSVSQNDFWEQYMVVDKSKFDKLVDEVESFDETSDMLSDARGQLLDKIDEINAESERKIEYIIANEIVKPIVHNIDAESSRLQREERSAEEQLKLFIKRLEDYDPLEYVNQEEIDEDLLMAQENIGEMETAVEESNLTFFEFVSDVYDTTDENYEALREEVELYNDETLFNINSTIEETKTSRQEKNQINSTLLNDFTQKLSYTRLGTLENQAVNEFIVSPLKIEGVDEVQTLNMSSDEKGNRKIPIIVAAAVLAAIILISRIFTYILQKKERGEMYETGL